MTRTCELETTLRSLDPADPLAAATSHRALADLHRILATDPSAGSLQPARAGRPPARRLVVAGAALAAVCAGIVALPSLTGGDQAFASWTPAPADVSSQQRSQAAEGCRRMQAEGAGADYAAQLSSARPAVAERRGAWTTVVLAGPGGFSAMCITDDSSPFFARDAIGSVGAPDDHAPPGLRELNAISLGVGTLAAGDLSLAAGAAGADVAGVVYRSPVHGEVAATLADGHFALWLPGDELAAASRDGVHVEVTYRDGSTGTTRLTL